MPDESDQIERGVLVAVIAIAVLVCFALNAKAEGFSVSVESKPLFSVTVETNPWLPPNPPKGPKVTVTVRVPRDDRHGLFFTQRGCPPCERTEAEFPKLEEEGLTVRDLGAFCHFSRIDINAHPEFAAKYDITQTPTFVMIEGGKRLGTKVGYQSAETLFAWWFDAKAPESPKAATAVWWTTEELRAFARTYNGPLRGIQGKRDDYRSHLLELPNHGFQWWQVSGLTQAECQKIHGAQHSGYISPIHIVK